MDKARPEDVAARASEALAARALLSALGGTAGDDASARRPCAERPAVQVLGEVLRQRICALLTAAGRLAEHACRSRLGPFDILDAAALLDGASQAATASELLRFAGQTTGGGAHVRVQPLDPPGRVLLRSADDRSSDDEDEDDGGVSVGVPQMPGMPHPGLMSPAMAVPGMPPHGMAPPGMAPLRSPAGVPMGVPMAYGAYAGHAPFAPSGVSPMSPMVSPTTAMAMPRFLASGQSSGIVSPRIMSPTLPGAASGMAAVGASRSGSGSIGGAPPYAAPHGAMLQVPATAQHMLGPMTTRRVRAERAPRPAYMLDIYPPLPRPHTFRWTETRGVRETDAVQLARQRAEQQRQAEASLIRLYARRRDDAGAGRMVVNYEDHV